MKIIEREASIAALRDELKLVRSDYKDVLKANRYLSEKLNVINAASEAGAGELS